MRLALFLLAVSGLRSVFGEGKPRFYGTEGQRLPTNPSSYARAAPSIQRKSDETVSIQTHRTLTAGTPFEHDFPVAVATTCYRSSYFSPYRLYTLNINTGTPGQTTFSFNLEVDQCPYSKAFCCGQNLDHLVMKLGELTAHARVCFESSNATCHAMTAST